MIKTSRFAEYLKVYICTKKVEVMIDLGKSYE